MAVLQKAKSPLDLRITEKNNKSCSKIQCQRIMLRAQDKIMEIKNK